MESLFQKGIMVGLGLLGMTKDKVEELVDDLSKRGEMTRAEARKVVNELMNKAEHRSEEMKKWIDVRIDEAMDRFRPKVLDRVEDLEKQVADLQKEVKKLHKAQQSTRDQA
jgi:polyhydroxyalkanoate synthesis regulator phasin